MSGKRRDRNDEPGKEQVGAGEPEYGPHEPEPPHKIDRYRIPGIEVRHRKVNRWLIVVYVAFAIWAIYYLITRWGGLGPGLSLS